MEDLTNMVEMHEELDYRFQEFSRENEEHFVCPLKFFLLKWPNTVSALIERKRKLVEELYSIPVYEVDVSSVSGYQKRIIVVLIF